MRRWLTAISVVSLFLIFPVSIGYLPYDHWDHAWPSVNIVVAFGLLCLTLCASFVRARSAISLTRCLLLGTAAVSAVAVSLGAPAFGIIIHHQFDFLSQHDALAMLVAIALAVLPGIFGRVRGWKSLSYAVPSSLLRYESASSYAMFVLISPRLPLRI